MKKNLKIIIPVIVAIVILAIVGIVFFTSNKGNNTDKVKNNSKVSSLARAVCLRWEQYPAD